MIYIVVATYILISPDEWATMKQACRDEMVVLFAIFL